MFITGVVRELSEFHTYSTGSALVMIASQVNVHSVISSSHVLLTVGLGTGTGDKKKKQVFYSHDVADNPILNTKRLHC